jgi:pimeloyl-ACP methyl ester carboxylesterase
MLIAGRSDRSVYPAPAAALKMHWEACTKMLGFHLVDGAGRWVQQEQPEQVSTLLLEFLRR